MEIYQRFKVTNKKSIFKNVNSKMFNLADSILGEVHNRNF